MKIITIWREDEEGQELEEQIKPELLSVVYSFVSFLLSISPLPPIMHCMVIISVSSVLCHIPAFLKGWSITYDEYDEEDYDEEDYDKEEYDKEGYYPV